MTNPRAATLAGRLAALGFADTAAAERILAADLGLAVTDADAAVLEAIAASSDPDRALSGLARIPREPGSGAEDLLAALRTDGGLRARLCAVLGASAALGDHLRRHPGDWRLLVGGDEVGGIPAPGPEDARTPDELRIAYRRGLLRLAARDLTGAVTLDEAAAALSDLAAGTLRGALAIARAQLPPDAPACRLAVIAMGKCGARELNYASDVDVIFVAEPPAPDPGRGRDPDDEAAALRSATQLASAMIRICSDAGPEGSLFPVDPNLRPEGRQGPLVRTLASHLAYYRRWAKTWEFQALLKARPVAGDADLGRAYVEALAPMVWNAAQREDFVADVQAMRRRVIASLPAAEADREIKLGPGGLRDIEFAVQLLQLVHGRADETLRDPATLPALAALAAGGYVGRQDAVSLAAAYRFLRAVEHLLQLRQLRRTHSLPTDPAVLRQIGRALRPMNLRGPDDGRGPDETSGPGVSGPGSSVGSGPTGATGAARRSQAAPPAVGLGRDPVAELTAAWRLHTTVARQLHEKLFYRPLLDAVARLPGEVIRLTSAAAVERLEALGYSDPVGALRHIEALTAGVSRKAAIQRALLPAMLGWFADAPRPDPALLAFRQVSEALGGSPWYLRLLRDDTRVAWRIARLLASGSYPIGLLLRAPEAVAMLADDDLLAPRPATALGTEASALIGRHLAGGAPDAGVAGLLALRRRELLRTAAADLLGMLTVTGAGDALSTITTTTIAGALDLAARKAGAGAQLPARMCVVAMGRYGGRELSYASDADVLFVYEPAAGADEEAAARAAHGVAEELTRLLARPGPDPSLRIDADLRPEGRQGPLVRTLAAYRAYYQRWARPWEAQALLRAAPAAGDQGLGDAFTALADEIRYPPGGMPADSVREIRRIKARMEAERMPRGVDPALHVKLGPGGLTDVEWVAQLLQLQHAGEITALRTTGTLPALTAAVDAGLLAAADEAELARAWLLAARIRNAVMLVRGRGSDVLPSRQDELAVVAYLLGYPPESAQDLTEDWRRAARHARAVMERVFYG